MDLKIFTIAVREFVFRFNFRSVKRYRNVVSVVFEMEFEGSLELGISVTLQLKIHQHRPSADVGNSNAISTSRTGPDLKNKYGSPGQNPLASRIFPHAPAPL